jgi:hypothetical protein
MIARTAAILFGMALVIGAFALGRVTAAWPADATAVVLPHRTTDTDARRHELVVSKEDARTIITSGPALPVRDAPRHLVMDPTPY